MRKLIQFINHSDLKYLLILALLCVVGYGQIALMVHPLIWDMIDYFFPSRFIIGEMLQQHLLPLWNPYQMLGYPIFTDPQSGAWYPITWVFGFFHGYSLNMISLEYIIHLIFAGWGMFFLGKTLGYHRLVSFIMAVAYLFCGFMIGNAQHLSWIISAAWLPFVINAFLALAKEKSLYASLKLSFFGFLMLSGGYPGFIFVLIYILFFLFIYFSVVEYRTRKIRGIINYYKYLALSMAILLVCSSIIVISYIYLMPELSRASGVTAEKALFSPFSPQCMLSFLAPLTAVFNGGTEYYHSDMSMTNGYFGILVFVFLMSGLWIKKSSIQWFFLIFAILTLFISFGSYTPLRMFLYDYVPLMNLFRFPALFRVFFILFFILSAGNTIQHIFIEKQKVPRSVFVVSLILLLGMGAFIVFFRSQGFLNIKDFIAHELFIFSINSTFQQHFVFHAAIQIGILLAFLFTLYKFKTTKLSLILICVLVSSEMIISTQLTASYTVYDSTFSNIKGQNFLNTLPSGFPIPSNTSVIKNESQAKKESPFWRNICTYNKTISHEGFNPFMLNDYKFLQDSLPQFFTTMLNNPPVYLSNSIFLRSQLKNHVAEKQLDSTYIFLGNEDFLQAKSVNTFDSAIGTAQIIKYSPNKVEVEINASKAAILILLQNKFLGWRATLNGQNAQIMTVNVATMGVKVPAGQSKVIFEYHPTPAYIGYYVSIFGFIILAIVLLFLWIREGWRRWKNTLNTDF